jgi:hypothetical protein
VSVAREFRLALTLWRQQASYWLELSSHDSPLGIIASGVFHNTDADGFDLILRAAIRQRSFESLQ